MKKSLFKSLLASVLFIFGVTSLSAQDYKLAVGARLGVPLSASVKTKIGEGKMIEASLGYRSTSRNFSYDYTRVNISVNYQMYTPLEDVLEGLHYYYGGGISAYFWTYEFSSDYNSTTFGFQANVGLDYKFDGKPVNVSLDYMPSFFFGGVIGGFGAGYGALAIRYTIGE